ncbi:hypothetical protein XENOCAPTIV_010193 [Xenoophorus captivus]|uniref:Fibronectin type-III domain-containing protein n=1 Tax=Xenoophorus captivus TaxID=1517983 RepID=A0ABV0R3C8_9TELE
MASLVEESCVLPLRWATQCLQELNVTDSSVINGIDHLLFTVAPPDVLALSIKEAPTTQSAEEEEYIERVDNVNNEAPSDNDVMISGTEPESSGMELLTDLTVNVTATSMSLTWSAPDEVFGSFLVELVAPLATAAQPQVIALPGSFRKAKIEGLLPSTLYEITLLGLMEGNRSLPLRVFTTTGTLSKYLFHIICRAEEVSNRGAKRPVEK